MWNDRWDTFDRFTFSEWRNDIGNSGFGLVHQTGEIPKPELPLTTEGLIGVDLTHVIHTSDIAAAKGGNGSGGSGGGGNNKGGGGSSGGGSGTTNPWDTPYTSGTGDPDLVYNITIEFKGEGWDQQYYDIFVGAADLLTSLINDDVADVNVVGLKGGPRLVDDIVISAELTAIDGTGGILGQAGPTSIRTGSYLPATAIMQFDSADAGSYLLGGLFDDIVLHEMAHSLGFGSIWSYLNLVSDTGLYTGEIALAVYKADIDSAAMGIPVETDGGSGTAGSHWDEGALDNEIMTGYIDATNYFSAFSAAAFADLGYGLSDDYTQLAWVDQTVAIA